MKKFPGIFIVSALLFGACSADEETPEPETEEVTDVGENEEAVTDVEEDENEESETDVEIVEEEEISTELDEDIRAELDQDFEEIDWDNVHLTRGQFDSMLYEFQDNLNSQYEKDEEMTVSIDSIDFSDDTIEITLDNKDDSEFAEITNGFLAVIIDSFYRQLYLNSDYSDGTTHPHIIIQESNGEIITDQEDFIEFEE